MSVNVDVAVVGVGLHPLGRFPGVTGIEMGAIAIRSALVYVGVEWKDIQFAFARQLRDRQPGRGRLRRSGSPASRSPTSTTAALLWLAC